MGRKSSAAAKDRRTAQRLIERQNRDILAERAAGYTEIRLAGIRAEIKEAIPKIGASVAWNAVDVLCLQTSPKFTDDESDRLLDVIKEEVEADLWEEGIEEEWLVTGHPISIIDIIINDEQYYHEREMLAAAAYYTKVEDTSGVEGTGATGTGGGANSTGAMGTAEAGDRRQSKTQVGPSASKQGRRGLGLQAQRKGPKAQGPRAQQQHKGTLGIDLGGRQRLPKPRSLGIVDEIMWGGAQQHALQEVTAEYSVPTEIEPYYSNMCRVGQQALADKIHSKTQAIYDARSAQKMKRENRKL